MNQIAATATDIASAATMVREITGMTAEAALDNAAQRFVRTGREAQMRTGSFRFEVTEAEIVAWTKEEMAGYKYPRIVEFVAELPKTSSGKIKRAQLRQG